MGCKITDSCKVLFINLNILPLPYQYIFHLLRFVIKNNDLFTTNNEMHALCTRQHRNFHQPSANLTKYQTGVFCMGINLYNILPSYIKMSLIIIKIWISLEETIMWERILFLGRISKLSQTSVVASWFSYGDCSDMVVSRNIAFNCASCSTKIANFSDLSLDYIYLL
jgi:hypothetical protein